MESEMITLLVKFNEGQNEMQVIVSLNETVTQLKEKLIEQSGLQQHEMKILYKGRVLKDNDILKEKGIQNNDTLYLCQNLIQDPLQPQQQLDNQQEFNENLQQKMNSINIEQVMQKMQQQGMMPDFGSKINFGFISSLMKNPMVKQMLSSMMSNPQIIQMAVNMNSSLKNQVQENPGMLEMLQNPQIIDQAFSMIDQMGSSGQGKASQQNQVNQSPPQEIDMQIPEDQNILQMMQKQQKKHKPVKKGQSQINKQEQKKNLYNYQVEPVEFEEIDETNEQKAFQDQIDQLNEMGFENLSENIIALKESKGNIEEAVKRLFERGCQK